jgi:hypothetical protein
LDSIVYCYDDADAFGEGALRLMAEDGAPSVDGFGRLEAYTYGTWAPVCREGFSAGSSVVACKHMGFAGVAAEAKSCATPAGVGYCSDVAPQISEVSCSGDEDSLFSCNFDVGDDVFCAANEAVVVSCSGVGDAQGRAPKPPSPHSALLSRSRLSGQQ